MTGNHPGNNLRAAGDRRGETGSRRKKVRKSCTVHILAHSKWPPSLQSAGKWNNVTGNYDNATGKWNDVIEKQNNVMGG
jgi:hypothetical protein